MLPITASGSALYGLAGTKRCAQSPAATCKVAACKACEHVWATCCNGCSSPAAAAAAVHLLLQRLQFTCCQVLLYSGVIGVTGDVICCVASPAMEVLFKCLCHVMAG